MPSAIAQRLSQHVYVRQEGSFVVLRSAMRPRAKSPLARRSSSSCCIRQARRCKRRPSSLRVPQTSTEQFPDKTNSARQVGRQGFLTNLGGSVLRSALGLRQLALGFSAVRSSPCCLCNCHSHGPRDRRRRCRHGWGLLWRRHARRNHIRYGRITGNRGDRLVARP